MCLALVKPAGVSVDEDAMQTAYEANKDGCGFAVRTPRGIIVAKGLWTFPDFWRQLCPYMGYDALIHFRWASKGTINRANCHPFVFPEGALIHNGHLDGYGTREHSDTAEWVTTLLIPLLATYPDALRQPALVRLLEDSLGDSKMALFTGKETVILNEHAGHWKDGVWYSNASYRPVPRRLLIPDAASLGDPWNRLGWDQPCPLEEQRCSLCGLQDAAYAVCDECLTSH